MDPEKLEKLRAECKKTVRSLLLSEKEGFSSYMLDKVHKDLMGYGVPFKQLGFPNIDSYLASIPDACYKVR